MAPNGWGSGKIGGGGLKFNSKGGNKQTLYFSFGTGEIFTSTNDPNAKFSAILLGHHQSPAKETKQEEQNDEDIIENSFERVENKSEENEDILVNERCIFRQFVVGTTDKDNKKTEGSWINRGTGTFHLNKDKTTGISRIIIRRDPMDAISVNARLAKHMNPQLVGKNIRLTLFEPPKGKDDKPQLVASLVGFKDADIAKKAFDKFTELYSKL